MAGTSKGAVKRLQSAGDKLQRWWTRKQLEDAVQKYKSAHREGGHHDSDESDRPV